MLWYLELYGSGIQEKRWGVVVLAFEPNLLAETFWRGTDGGSSWRWNSKAHASQAHGSKRSVRKSRAKVNV